jgi:hypothetical protein
MQIKHIFTRPTKNTIIIVAHLHQKEISGGLFVKHSLAVIDTTTFYQLNQPETQLLFPALLARN